MMTIQSGWTTAVLLCAKASLIHGPACFLVDHRNGLFFPFLSQHFLGASVLAQAFWFLRGHFRLKNEQNRFFDHASQNGGKSEVEREHLPCQNACDCRRKICRSGGTAHFGQFVTVRTCPLRCHFYKPS